MQKKIFVACSFLALAVIIGFSAIGCGSSTSTTTTGTVAAAQLDTAKSGVLLAGGAASVGVAATGIGGAAGTSTSAYTVRSSWLKAMMGNPPPAFFTLDMTTGTASVDGYFMPLATAPMGGKVTPYIRLRNVSDEVITGAYFSGKTIADLSPCSVESIFAGSPTVAPYGIVEGMQHFATTSPHPMNSIKYMGDYLCWAYIYPTIEAMSNARKGTRPTLPALTDPRATDKDKIGSMDNKMVFTGTVTGEILVNVACEPAGQAKVKTHTGTGKLYTPVAAMAVTTNITFTTLGDPPTSVTVIGTNETAPLYTTIVYITSPTTGVGTGEIWDFTTTPATKIGTLTSSSTGGSVTVGVTTETFTF